MTRLSVIIPTLNRPTQVVDVLNDLAAQLGRDDEVILVDQSTPDAFQEVSQWILNNPGPIQHLHREKRGLPAARNAGIEASRGHWVLFLDDDVRLHSGCIQAHTEALADPDVGGVVGQIIETSLGANASTTANRVTRAGRVITNLTGNIAMPIQSLKGANMSFQRAALVAAGPFDVGFRGTSLLEDADMSLRVQNKGWSLRYEPRALVTHLSTPLGGVRVDNLRNTERWRFHNAAYFVHKHGGGGAALPSLLTFAAIATKRTAQWRDPTALTFLLSGWYRGWKQAK